MRRRRRRRNRQEEDGRKHEKEKKNERRRRRIKNTIVCTLSITKVKCWFSLLIAAVFSCVRLEDWVCRPQGKIMLLSTSEASRE